MIAIINKTDKVLSKEEYQEYLEYRKQADKEAEKWDSQGHTLSKEAFDNFNCHCTCGEVEYDIEDAEEDIDTLFELLDKHKTYNIQDTETILDRLDDLEGEVRFNKNIQILVNKTFIEDIQEIKDGLDRLAKGQERSAGSKRVDDKKTNPKTARRSVDGVEKGK